MNLTEIVAGFDAFEAAIEANQGELTEELASQYDVLNVALRDKLDGYKFYMDMLENDAAGYDAKRAHYQKLADEQAVHRDAKKNRIKWLKTRVLEHMKLRGVTELEGEQFHFKSVRSGKPPVEVLVDPSELPAVWQTVVISANKEAIRRDLENWKAADCPPHQQPAFVRLGEPTLSLRVF